MIYSNNINKDSNENLCFSYFYILWDKIFIRQYFREKSLKKKQIFNQCSVSVKRVCMWKHVFVLLLFYVTFRFNDFIIYYLFIHVTEIELKLKVISEFCSEHRDWLHYDDVI